MAILKKIALRLLLLVVIFLLVNFVYKNTLWKLDIDTYNAESLIDLLNAQDSADVIYMGESSNFTAYENDSCKKKISEFTADYFPTLVFKSVNKSAIHAGNYLALLKQVKNNRRLQTVVITLNLRSFDADWINSKLETSLQQTNVFIQTYPPIINRFLLSLNVYDKKTDEQRHKEFLTRLKHDTLKFRYDFKYKTTHEWDSAIANGTYKNEDGSWNMPKIQLACCYIKVYGFQIDTLTNPRIRDFDNIVKLCKKKNLHLVFNLLAENIQYADSLVGKDLVLLMQQNRDLLMSRYNEDGVLVADNLELVCGKDYIDQNWATEHYKQRGRISIAHNLSESLKQIYPKEYKAVKINIGENWFYNYKVSKALRDIEKSIQSTPEWIENIKTKAKQRKISIDEMIKLDAIYMYNTEIKPKEK